MAAPAGETQSGSPAHPASGNPAGEDAPAGNPSGPEARAAKNRAVQFPTGGPRDTLSSDNLTVLAGLATAIEARRAALVPAFDTCRQRLGRARSWVSARRLAPPPLQPGRRTTAWIEALSSLQRTEATLALRLDAAAVDLHFGLNEAVRSSYLKLVQAFRALAGSGRIWHAFPIVIGEGAQRPPHRFIAQRNSQRARAWTPTRFTVGFAPPFRCRLPAMGFGSANGAELFLLPGFFVFARPEQEANAGMTHGVALIDLKDLTIRCTLRRAVPRFDRTEDRPKSEHRSGLQGEIEIESRSGFYERFVADDGNAVEAFGRAMEVFRNAVARETPVAVDTEATNAPAFLDLAIADLAPPPVPELPQELPLDFRWQWPRWRLPRWQMPQWQMPQWHFPQWHFPRWHIPRWHLPSVALPRMQIPRMQAPRVQMPRVRMPRVQMPAWEMPRWRLPQWKLARWQLSRWDLPRWRLSQWSLRRRTWRRRFRVDGLRSLRWRLSRQVRRHVPRRLPWTLSQHLPSATPSLLRRRWQRQLRRSAAQLPSRSAGASMVTATVAFCCGIAAAALALHAMPSFQKTPPATVQSADATASLASLVSRAGPAPATAPAAAEGTIAPVAVVNPPASAVTAPPDAEASTGAEALTAEEVEELQSKLRALQYYYGTVNGRLTPQTIKAFNTWRSETDRPQRPKIDHDDFQTFVAEISR